MTRIEVEGLLAQGGDIKDHAVKVCGALYGLLERFVVAHEILAASVASLDKTLEHRAEVELHGVK